MEKARKKKVGMCKLINDFTLLCLLLNMKRRNQMKLQVIKFKRDKQNFLLIH